MTRRVRWSYEGWHGTAEVVAERPDEVALYLSPHVPDFWIPTTAIKEDNVVVHTVTRPSVKGTGKLLRACVVEVFRALDLSGLPPMDAWGDDAMDELRCAALNAHVLLEMLQEIGDENDVSPTFQAWLDEPVSEWLSGEGEVRWNLHEILERIGEDESAAAYEAWVEED